MSGYSGYSEVVWLEFSDIEMVAMMSDVSSEYSCDWFIAIWVLIIDVGISWDLGNLSNIGLDFKGTGNHQSSFFDWMSNPMIWDTTPLIYIQLAMFI